MKFKSIFYSEGFTSIPTALTANKGIEGANYKQPETSLQWAATHLTLNHGFPIIRLSRPKKIA